MRRRTWTPHQPVVTASTPDARTGLQGLYWLVTYQGIRYWIGPAQGPAAHIHQEQARTLARALDGSAQNGARRHRRAR